MSMYTLDPNDSSFFIQLSETLAIDSTADNNSFIQTDTRALTQFLSAGQDTDFAIYCEVPKWQFFNPSMDWKFSLTNILDPTTGVLQGSVIQDGHNPSGTPVVNLNNDIVLSDNTKNTAKNYVNTTRWTHFKQCSKFYTYSFPVGNTIIVPVQDASGNAVLNASGVAQTRIAQLYAVYIDRVTGEPLPYAYSPDNNTQIYYYTDNVSTGNALTTIADSAALRTTIDNSGYLVTSIVPPNPNMVRRVPDSSGNGDNTISYLTNLAKVTTFEMPPVGMRTQNQLISVNNIFLDGYYLTSATSNSTNAWMAFSKGTNMWASSSGLFSASGAASYTGSVTTACGAVNVSGEWVQLQLPRAASVTQYRLAPITVNLGPSRYSLYGSATGTGSGWVLLDTRSGITWTSSSAVTNILNTPPSQMYQYYRLVIEQTQSSINAGIAELTLIDGATSAQYPPSAMTADTSTLADGTYVSSCSSTANAVPGPDATTNAAFRAFDRTDGTFFLSATGRYNWGGSPYIGAATNNDLSGGSVTGESIQIFFPNAMQVTSYTITSSGRISAPMDFTLLGSYTGYDWFKLDIQTGISDWGATTSSAGSTKTFTLGNNTFMNTLPMSFYRLCVQKVTNTDQLVISELRYNAKPSTFPNFRIPSAAMSAATQTMTLNNQLLNGTYTIKSSSSFPQGVTSVFDNHGSLATSDASYTGSIYTGTVLTTDASTNITYSGEYVQLQCSSGIRAVSYRLTGAAPTRFTMMGSLDGTNWRRLDSSSQDFSDTYASPGRVFTMTALSGVFTYYRLVAQEPGANRTSLNVGELKIIDSTAVEHPPTNMTNSNTATVSGITYTSSASSLSSNAFRAFDGSASIVYQSSATYTITSYYRGLNSTTTVSGVTYPGEWVQLGLPMDTVLSHYQIQPYNISAGVNIEDYVVLGSNNETSWVLLDQRVGVQRLVAPSGTLSIPVTQFLTSTPSAYRFYRFIASKMTNSTTLNIGNLLFYARVNTTLPSNALFWSPPAVYQTSNTSFGAQMRHMSTDPSRALMLYWDVGPTADRPFQGDEFYLAWSSVPIASSGTLPVKDIDLSAVDYSTQVGLAYNKFSVQQFLPASTVRNVRVGIQSQLTASGAPRLYLPVSGYRVSQNAAIQRIPFYYELANTATMSDDITRSSVGGRVMQLLSHYLYNGIIDTQANYFPGFKTESSRVTDSMVDRLYALWRPNTTATYNRRNDFLSQLMSRYGRQYFANAVTVTNADGTQTGTVREVLRNIDDMFLNFSMQVGRRVARRGAARMDTLQFLDIPVVMRLTNSMFADGSGTFLNFDANFVNASGTTASGTLVTTWPNLCYRSAYTAYGSHDVATAATVSGLTSSGAVLTTDSSGMPAVFLNRNTLSYLSLPSVTFNGSIATRGITIANVCAFTTDTASVSAGAAAYEGPLTMSIGNGTTNNQISLLRSSNNNYSAIITANFNASGTSGAGFSVPEMQQRALYVYTLTPSGANATSLNAWVNGNQRITNFNVPAAMSHVTFDFVRIGQTTGTLAQRALFHGTINQIQVYTRALNTSEVALLNAQLRYKWNL